MRLKVTLQGSGKVNLNHSYYLASLIYRSIEKTDPTLSLELHKPSTFKFFTFSKLMVPKKKFRIVGDEMVVDGEAYFYFSTMRDYVGVCLVEGLLAKPEIKIGDAKFVVSEIKVLKEKEIDERERFVTLSPVNVTTVENNGRKRIVDLYPENPKFYENLKNNLVKKYTAFYGKEPDDYEVKFRVLKSKPKRIKLKDTFHRCVEMVFEAEGSKELLEVGYKAGFGERNSMGFGMVKVV